MSSTGVFPTGVCSKWVIFLGELGSSTAAVGLKEAVLPLVAVAVGIISTACGNYGIKGVGRVPIAVICCAHPVDHTQ